MVTSTNPSAGPTREPAKGPVHGQLNGQANGLLSAVRETHDRLVALLAAAREMGVPRGTPRAAHERIDAFLATACRHLHAVDAVLLPAARRELPDGSTLVHAHLRSVKELEVMLAHVKARQYGSVYETSFAWPRIWSEVETAMTEHRRLEEELCRRMAERLDEARLAELADALSSAEPVGPTRPHPYTPHTGLAGLVARRVMLTADRIWDAFEGRMVPEPEHAPKREPGRIAQYFLADPRF
jgi:hypothetical protein